MIFYLESFPLREALFLKERMEYAAWSLGNLLKVLYRYCVDGLSMDVLAVIGSKWYNWYRTYVWDFSYLERGML